MLMNWLSDNRVTSWWQEITARKEPIAASAPWDIGFSDWGRILARAIRGGAADDFGMVASSIAFAAFLSILPLLSVVALTYGALVPREVVLEHVTTLSSILPGLVQSFVQDWLGKSLTRRDGSGMALALSVGLMLFSGRRVGRSLLHGINIATGIEQDRNPIAAQVAALLTVGAGALLLFAALLSLSGLAILGNVMPEGLPAVGRILNIVLWLTLTLGPGLALLLVYRYVPARSAIPWRWTIPGTVVAVAVWSASTLGFQLYVTNVARYDSIYGSLSAVVVLQLWFMLSAYILLLGAKVNAEAMLRADVAR